MQGHLIFASIFFYITAQETNFFVITNQTHCENSKSRNAMEEEMGEHEACCFVIITVSCCIAFVSMYDLRIQ
jgi:hypothetical protein